MIITQKNNDLVNRSEFCGLKIPVLNSPKMVKSFLIGFKAYPRFLAVSSIPPNPSTAITSPTIKIIIVSSTNPEGGSVGCGVGLGAWQQEAIVGFWTHAA